MRDAMGGLVNIVIVVVFLVIVSGYMAFNVNYTKAFRVKNKIISTIEQYEGITNSEVNSIIQDYMLQIGYDRSNPPKMEDEGYTCPNGLGYCYKKVASRDKDTSDTKDMKNKVYYKVATQITIDIPIIKNIMPNLNVFRVTGDTKTIIER